MDAETSKNRRSFYIITALILLALINLGLFLYLRYTKEDSWSFIEKNDGTILLGRVELLEGGYLQISDVYQLIYTLPRVEQREGDQFRLEIIGQGVVSVVKIATFDYAQIGPGEVKQWGPVPEGSRIQKRLWELEAEQLSSI